MREALRNFFQIFIGWEKGGADTCGNADLIAAPSLTVKTMVK